MSKIRKILQLKEAKLSQRQISRAINLSRPVISEIITKCEANFISYANAAEMSDSQLDEIVYGAKKTSSKAEKLISLFPKMALELTDTGVTKQRLWTEYLEEYPDGLNYSQFCHLFKVWQKALELSMHIEYTAGDKLLVDFAGKKLKIFDRKKQSFREAEVLVAVLGCSGLLYVEAMETQDTHTFIRGVENSLHYIGGVPNAIVSDNLKAAVIKADKYEPELNQQTEDFARHYRTALLPARARKPKDKALVESAVSLTYQRIYAPLRNRTFHSIQELNIAIKPLLEAHNNRKMSKMPVSRRELFNDREKKALKALPVERYPLKEFCTGKAAFNYHVYHKKDQHYYSIPYLYAGKEVTMIYDSKNVAVYHQNERICLHRRDRQKYKYSTNPDHMPPNHRFYHEWSPERFKSWAKAIGKETNLVISHILSSKPHPEQAFKSCMGILNLEKKYSSEILNLACRSVWNRGTINYKQVKLTIEVVKKQIEENNISNWKELPQTHENIRGNKYN